jgi:lysophospholipase L1-like esterase
MSRQIGGLRPRSPPGAAAGPVRLTWKHKLLLAGFGVFLVGLLELALRVAGFGGRVPLLHPLDLSPPPEGLPAGARLYEVHPRMAELFFARTGPGGAEMSGSHRRELAVLPKPTGTLRIVVVGASTIEGFPMTRNLTSARFLEAMLRHLVPDRRVEVLNLGVTALASFPIRKIAIDALAHLEPDLVVVYEAHNEFFGASGMASLQSMGRSVGSMELIYRLRQLGLAQVAEALLARPTPPRGDRREQLIRIMAATDEIQPGGDLHAAARRSLVANYRAIVREGRRRGIPVVLSTVVSNERDLVPVASFLGDVPAERRPDWERRLGEAKARAARDPAAALELFRGLQEEAPRHAQAAYELARALEAAGRPSETAEAAEMYRRARDLDAMPWRASRDKNEALRRLAAEEGAPLADAEAVFARAAQAGPAPGVTGWALFFDHVHPSLEGQALLARAFLDTLVDHRLVEVDPARRASLPEPREIASRLGANPLELYALTHKMATLFRSPPFAANNRAAAERAERLLARFRQTAGPLDLEALRLWEEGSREADFTLPISFFGGIAAVGAGAHEEAQRYLGAAADSALPFSDERCAARLLSAVTAVRAGEDPRDTGRRTAAALREAQQVASLPDQPTPLLARALAGLFFLAGDPFGGGDYSARADQLAASAPAWQKPLLRALPEPRSLASLSRGVILPATAPAGSRQDHGTAPTTPSLPPG